MERKTKNILSLELKRSRNPITSDFVVAIGLQTVSHCPTHSPWCKFIVKTMHWILKYRLQLMFCASTEYCIPPLDRQTIKSHAPFGIHAVSFISHNWHVACVRVFVRVFCMMLNRGEFKTALTLYHSNSEYVHEISHTRTHRNPYR